MDRPFCNWADSLRPTARFDPRHLPREDRGFEDIHDRPASDGCRFLAFYVEVKLSGYDNENCSAVGMHARGVFRARCTGVIGCILFRVENDLFGPCALFTHHVCTGPPPPLAPPCCCAEATLHSDATRKATATADGILIVVLLSKNSRQQKPQSD